MLISKFPNLQKSKSNQRQLLTKPSSWAKLVCLVALVIFISWLNLKPPKSTAKNDGLVPSPQPQPVKLVKPESKSKLEELIGKADDLVVVLKAGKKFMEEKRYADAQLAFLRATELAPDYRDVWYLLAVSYISEYNQNPVIKPADYSLSKLDRAIFALTRAHLLDPQSEKIKQLLETAKQARGD